MMYCIPRKLGCKGVIRDIVNVACIKAVVVQTGTHVYYHKQKKEKKVGFGTTFIYKIGADESGRYIFTPQLFLLRSTDDKVKETSSAPNNMLVYRGVHQSSCLHLSWRHILKAQLVSHRRHLPRHPGQPLTALLAPHHFLLLHPLPWPSSVFVLSL